jgi:hypothetical protein
MAMHPAVQSPRIRQLVGTLLVSGAITMAGPAAIASAFPGFDGDSIGHPQIPGNIVSAPPVPSNSSDVPSNYGSDVPLNYGPDETQPPSGAFWPLIDSAPARGGSHSYDADSTAKARAHATLRRVQEMLDILKGMNPCSGRPGC